MWEFWLGYWWAVLIYGLAFGFVTKIVIKNKGFKNVNGNWRGDFVFTVIVQTPKKLTKEQRELLNELAKTMNEQPPIKKKGIFG